MKPGISARDGGNDPKLVCQCPVRAESVSKSNCHMGGSELLNPVDPLFGEV
jgi:hypothetical protein